MLNEGPLPVFNRVKAASRQTDIAVHSERACIISVSVYGTQKVQTFVCSRLEADPADRIGLGFRLGL